MSARVRGRRRVALGLLLVALFAAPAPAVLAQEPKPSGNELRETYPLKEASPTEAPAAPEAESAAPAAPRRADGGSSVQPIIAAGLALLALAAGFVLGLRPRRRRRLPAALRVSAGGNR